MKAGQARFAMIGLAALATGCASMSTGGGGGGSVAAGTEITRFHLGQTIARGEIAVEPLEAAQAGGIEFERHAAAVERELTALGWTVVRGNSRSEQVAQIRVQQGARESSGRRSGLSIGLGGGVGSVGGGRRGGVGGGVGAGVTVPIGGRNGGVVVTELSVRMQRRSDGTAIWEGRAQSEARGGTPATDRANAVDSLARALFQGFPGESGRTIRVR